METLKKPLVATLFALVLCFCKVSTATKEKKTEDQKSTYIVHVDRSQMPASFMHHSEWYESFLKSVSHSAKMIYVYENVHGFSTSLTPQEAELLKNQPGVLAVLQSRMHRIQTTRTPHFLGLDKIKDLPIGHKPNATSEVIIGLLDTGVWPESKSFNDAGMGSIPSTWKGKCEKGQNFTAANCNKKLIGARFYSSGFESLWGIINETNEFKSPRDRDGHGSHTASTAAGSPVKGANLLGYATGTARGMAPHARVAMYKVCWYALCEESDVLAAMDQAISDNVNILSLSLGGHSEQYYNNSIAIGAFAAMEKGILVSCSAGNSGPTGGAIYNVAPWLVSVGASTLDRDLPAYVSLGNGQIYHGVGIHNGKPLPDTLPFIYAANASKDGSADCEEGSLDPKKVKGKIVLCDVGGVGRTEMGYNVKSAGGLAMVIPNQEREDMLVEAHVLPVSTVDYKAGKAIKDYLSSDPKPTATITFNGTKLGVKPAPVIASFSSRGPNPITPQILKPDLIAPGVNILAAWSRAVSPSGLDEGKDKRRVDFNVIAGTSMSCPHVSGLAALIKSFHPDWSPAVIRSALMTTAYTTYANGQRILDGATSNSSTPLDYGAGHVNPVAALGPGLVYDITVDDYLELLCAFNYTAEQIKVLTKRTLKCEDSKKYSVTDLNYPSFAVVFDSATKVVKHTRTLTNVGPAGTYKVSVTSQTPSVKISVKPDVLRFKEKGKKSYTVMFTSSGSRHLKDKFGFGRLEWSDGQHVVGSPITFSYS